MRPLEREDLYRLKIVGDVAISPDGKNVAYVVKCLSKDQDDYVGNIHVWTNGQSRQYTFSGKDSAPRWSPDGKRLAFLSSRAERNQIFVLHSSGGEAYQVTHLDLGAGEPVWSPDSKSLAFSAATRFPPDGGEPAQTKSGDPLAKVIDRAVYKFDGAGFNHDRRYHIHVVSADAPYECQQLTYGDYNDRSPAWSPDGYHLAFSANRRPNWDTERGSDIWLIPITGGDPRLLTDEDGMWMDPVFSPDGRCIAFTGFPIPPGADPDYYPQIWTMNRSGKDRVNILAETPLDVGRSIASDWATGGNSGLTWNDQGIYFLASRSGTCQVFLATPDHVSSMTEGDHDVMCYSVSCGASVAYAKSDSTHPAEVFLRSDAAETRLTDENDELVESIALEHPETITIRGAMDEQVDGWLFKPHNFQPDQAYPLLLYIHGGPASAYGHSFFHELQWWAAQGYGVAYCNPHGSASYGRDFQNCIRHDWGNHDYQDVMAFLDAAVERPWIDQGRLAAAGGSYGGYMVNWLAGHTDRFSAFCTQRSICNMVSQGGTSDVAAFRQERSGGTPEGNPEILWNQSPLKYASNVRTPTLILHQELDHRCPIEQGEQWFLALKRMGVPTRFIRFPQESHGLSRTGKPSRRYARLQFMLDWFREYV